MIEVDFELGEDGIKFGVDALVPLIDQVLETLGALIEGLLTLFEPLLPFVEALELLIEVLEMRHDALAGGQVHLQSIGATLRLDKDDTKALAWQVVLDDLDTRNNHEMHNGKRPNCHTTLTQV